MQLLAGNTDYGNVTTGNRDSAVTVLKINPIIQLILLAGALSGAGYFTIRLYKELQSL